MMVRVLQNANCYPNPYYWAAFVVLKQRDKEHQNLLLTLRHRFKLDISSVYNLAYGFAPKHPINLLIRVICVYP